MSQEIFDYSDYRDPTLYKEVEYHPEFSFSVRGHHLANYTELLTNLIDSTNKDLHTFAGLFAESQTNFLLQSDVYKDRNFREFLGYDADDSRVPATYQEDLMQGKPKEYEKRMASTYYDFLSFPDMTCTTLGPVIDGICKSCAFADDLGGFHCKNMNAAKEEYNALYIVKEADMYLSTTSIPKNEEYPRTVTFENFVMPAEIKETYSFERNNQQPKRYVLPLGLLRDVLVFTITRDQFMNNKSNNIYYSYNQMLQDKGIAMPRREK